MKFIVKNCTRTPKAHRHARDACTFYKTPATPTASKSNAPKTAITSFPLDPIIGDTPPNAGAAPSDVATLLFGSGVTFSLNFGVVIGAGVTTPGAATLAG